MLLPYGEQLLLACCFAGAFVGLLVGKALLRQQMYLGGVGGAVVGVYLYNKEVRQPSERKRRRERGREGGGGEAWLECGGGSCGQGGGASELASHSSSGDNGVCMCVWYRATTVSVRVRWASWCCTRVVGATTRGRSSSSTGRPGACTSGPSRNSRCLTGRG